MSCWGIQVLAHRFVRACKSVVRPAGLGVPEQDRAWRTFWGKGDSGRITRYHGAAVVVFSPPRRRASEGQGMTAICEYYGGCCSSCASMRSQFFGSSMGVFARFVSAGPGMSLSPLSLSWPGSGSCCPRKSGSRLPPLSKGCGRGFRRTVRRPSLFVHYMSTARLV